MTWVMMRSTAVAWRSNNAAFAAKSKRNHDPPALHGAFGLRGRSMWGHARVPMSSRWALARLKVSNPLEMLGYRSALSTSEIVRTFRSCMAFLPSYTCTLDNLRSNHDTAGAPVVAGDNPP
jgi:hypothetical protein